MTGGTRDRPGQRGVHLLLHPTLEHLVRSVSDSAAELLARKLEPDDQGRVAGFAGPEPVLRRPQGRAGLGELERPHDAAAVVRVDRGGGACIALG